MDCKVILSPRAIQDLREIVRYISFDDPHSGEEFGYVLIDAALSLGKLPERGRFVPEFADGTTRELIYGRYRIVYRINPDQKTVWVSRFWHSPRGAPEVSQGPVVLVQANPAACRKVARLNALTSKTWNTPVLAGPFLLLRNDQEAVCYRLPERGQHQRLVAGSPEKQ